MVPGKILNFLFEIIQKYFVYNAWENIKKGK